MEVHRGPLGSRSAAARLGSLCVPVLGFCSPVALSSQMVLNIDPYTCYECIEADKSPHNLETAAGAHVSFSAKAERGASKKPRRRLPYHILASTPITLS